MMRSKDESILQKACVRWFSYQYPQYDKLFFAVPNGGSRNVIEASNLKAEGVTAGVSDLLFLHPRKQYPYLCIEMKTDKGKQSEEQIKFMDQVLRVGGKYEICRSLEQFIGLIEDYLK